MNIHSAKHLIDIQEFSATLSELSRLLNRPVFSGKCIYSQIFNGIFITGELKAKPPLNRNIMAIIEAHNRGDVIVRQYGLTRLASLILDLQEIEKCSDKILRYFRKKYKEITENEYYGFRLEVDITATLIRKNVSFENEKRDEKFGDIRISETQPNSFFECTTCHVDKQKFNSFTYKIKAAIYQKMKKVYCNESTALIIDVTNIFNARAKIYAPLSGTELDTCIGEIQGEPMFGSIILHSYFINEDGEEARFQNGYLRYDCSHISHHLYLALERVFPVNKNLRSASQVAFMGNY